MSLLLLFSAALAAAPRMDPAVKAVLACGEDPAIACPPAKAMFDRVFLEGGAFPPAPLSLVAIDRAQAAGLARVEGAADRAAVDDLVAAALARVDRGVGPDAEQVEQLVFGYFGQELVDTYAELPGPSGPAVDEALARPPRSRGAVLTALDGRCRRDFESFHLEEYGAPLARPVGGVSWILAGWRSGELASRLDAAMYWGFIDSWCSAPTRALGGAPDLPGPRTPFERALLVGHDAHGFVVLGGEWPSESAVQVRLDRADVLFTYEEKRAALRR